MKLSKSRYTRGLQCSKILWLETHRPEVRDEAQASSGALAEGVAVGDLARGYFGPYVLVGAGGHDLTAMLEQTRVLMAEGASVIAEAAFAVDNNLCLVDVLRRTDDGWQLIEVKSSLDRDARRDDGPKDIHLDDLAYQYFVLGEAGVQVSSVHLMRINPGYVREGELDLTQLFTLRDVSDSVRQRQPRVVDAIARLTTEVGQTHEPATPIGRHCSTPNPCAFQGHCWSGVPEFSVFNLFPVEKAAGHFASGVVTAADVVSHEISVAESKRLPLVFETQERADHIDAEAIGEFLDRTMRYPVSFLDFETFFTEAIPRWSGIKPYQQIVFQYSLHVQDAPFAKPRHREFLAPLGQNPRRLAAERLVADVPTEGTVVAWNKSFEISRIREFAADFPDLADSLLAINERVVDLGDPFKAKHYYNRAMRGSWSLKYVLPALFPNDPELDYGALDGVHNGGDASETYRTLHLVDDPDEVERVRRALLAYCRLDTFATVKILDRLQQARSAPC